MTMHLGNVPSGTTLYIPFATYDGATGASETCSGLAVTDIEIYKNGSTTQRASDNGYTLLDTDGIDFDGLTGINGFSVDLSDNTDSGFYAVGSTYWVVVSSITADSQTVNFIAATFRIVAAEATTGYPNADVGKIGGQTASASGTITFPNATLASTTNITAGTITTATNVTTVNGLAANVITATSIAADAITDAKVASDVTIASVTGAVGSVTGNVGGNVTGSVGSIATGGIAAASFAAGAINAAAIANDAIDADSLAADAVTEIQSGLATAANLATVAGYIDTEVAAIKAVTDAITATGTGLSAIPWNASWDAEVQSEVDDALKVALTEGYRGTGATGSVRDLLYEIIAHLGESAISSTTKTLKKLDGSTTAKTYTLDSATTPTSITETT